MTRSNNTCSSLLLILLGVSSFSGCQTLVTATNHLPLTAQTAAAQDHVTVEVRPAHGKASRKQIAHNANMRLQDVVGTADVKFRNRDIYIVRVSPQTGQKHKLSASYDRAARRISMETDYAVQPGDRVVIAQDMTTALERVMANFLGRS